jgi:hypothetical protein
VRIAAISAQDVAGIAGVMRQARLAAYSFERDTAIDRRGAVRALGAWLDYADALPDADRLRLASRVAKTRSLIESAYSLDYRSRTLDTKV